MAHFCYFNKDDPVASVDIDLLANIQLALWGGGPTGEDLQIVVTGENPVARVRLLPKQISTIGPHGRPAG
jgi:hypothetical protein